jgi:hypothetical protein
MSIKLADTNVIKPMLGSTVLASLDTASAVNVNFDFINGTVAVAVPIGTMVNGQFSPNQTSFPLTIVINPITGVYTPSNLALCKAGQLTPEQMVAWQALVNSVRTQLEQLLIGDSIISGTLQTP